MEGACVRTQVVVSAVRPVIRRRIVLLFEPVKSCAASPVIIERTDETFLPEASDTDLTDVKH